ncbi:putative RNA methyltransferase At5g51130 [Silene latifolia]|uniref:putative RNA methyltransferase At5g51130 n=1 Tax=Silene latifolia TaxID=37657 RepID=UPI003D772447
MSETPENSEIKEPITNTEVKKDEVNKKRKYKEIAPFGNYHSYYGYRVGNDMDKDPRFKVLKKEWFEGKDCLDIGCNSGLITLNIAKKFNCRTILGIDIDKVRITDAWSNLKNFAQRKNSRNHTNMGPKLKIATDLNELRCAETCSTSGEEVKSGCFSVESNLSNIVSFEHGNFVSSSYQVPHEKYDTIICLSVTKWVHLNWGDKGLFTLFSKIWRHLHPGGVLVLEPQPWVSYYKNRLTTETTKKYYHEIIYKPNEFQEILLDKIGFRTVEHATSSVSGARVGFDRPVLVFRK